MKWHMSGWLHTGLILASLIVIGSVTEIGEAATPAAPASFPRSLESYGDQNMTRIPAILWNRVQAEPFNLAATLIFFCASGEQRTC